MAVQKVIETSMLSYSGVDDSIVKMAFAGQYLNDAQQATFDVVDGKTDIAIKGSFSQNSNVVKKDGYKTVTASPFYINESIVDNARNSRVKRIGETIYGNLSGGISDSRAMEIQSELEGFGKLKNRALRLRKKVACSLLISGKVVVSSDGLEANEVDYAPENIIVNDNSTDGQYQWNDGLNSNPVKQLELQALSMKSNAPDTFVLGFEAHKAFISNPNTTTAQNATAGKAKNFTLSTIEEKNEKSTDTFIFVGTTNGNYGKSLEIYLEADEYNDGTADVFYFDKNYAAGFKRFNEMNGQIHFCQVPVTVGNGSSLDFRYEAKIEDLDAEPLKDPVGIKRYYKSSVLFTMNNPKSYCSIKATLV